MKRSKNKIIMVVLTAAIINNGITPIKAIASTNNSNYSVVNKGSKEEVIYINLKGNGEVNNAYVVNIIDSPTILDYGNYSEIRNMNTNDKLSYNNGEITGVNSADKLYYQGTLNEVEIPWNIDIKYYLDGKEISCDDIAGKSGALEIKLSIIENKKCNNTFFENYALQSTLVLNTEKCTNIQAEGATIANVGKAKQLSYIILPNQGKEISIKSDVKDFEMSSISINGVKLGLNIDIDDDELIDRVSELSDAIEKLNSGAITVNEGTSILNNSTVNLTSGVDSLNSGVSSLNDGILKVYSALEELNNNSETLITGSKEVLTALNQIGLALNNLNISTENISNLISASSDIQIGINDLVSAITSLQSNISYETYKTVMNNNGLDIDELQSNNINALQSINNQITILISMRDNLLSSGLSSDDSQVIQIQSQIDTLNQVITLLQGNIASIKGTESYLNTASNGIENILSGATTLQSKYTEFNSAIISLGNMIEDMLYNMSTLSNSINTLISQYDKLDSGINNYTNAITSLLNGYSEIVNGSTSLVNGTSSLKTGCDKLSSGVSDLYSGTTELSNGTLTLNDKTSNLDIEITNEVNKIIDNLDGTSDEIISFVSKKNTSINSVQFVIKTPTIESKKLSNIEPVSATLSLWQKIVNLFK